MSVILNYLRIGIERSIIFVPVLAEKFFTEKRRKQISTQEVDNMARNFTIKQKDGVSYAVSELDDFLEIQDNYDGQLDGSVFVIPLSEDVIEQLKKDDYADKYDIEQLEICDKAVFGKFSDLEDFIGSGANH